jgi:hypothetical protein
MNFPLSRGTFLDDKELLVVHIQQVLYDGFNGLSFPNSMYAHPQCFTSETLSPLKDV